jgi:hypothetical protein
MENQTGENHIILFLYHVKITFIGITNFQDSLATAGRRNPPPDLQAPPEGSSNSLIYQH